MAKVTLAKALKIKNQLVGEINKIKSSIVAHNNYDNRNAAKYNVADNFPVLTEKIVQLTQLKTVIEKANEPIRKVIFEKAEFSALLEYYSTIPVNEGIIDGYGDKQTTIVSQVSQKIIDESSATLQKVINQLQDEMDNHNHKTLIEISDSLI